MLTRPVISVRITPFSLLSASMMLMLSWCFTGCDGDTGFTKSNDAHSGTHGTSADGTSSTDDTTVTDSFVVNLENTHQAQTPVDMLWIIDNSGTMGKHVAGVKNGIKQFIKELEQLNAVLRVSLISYGQEHYRKCRGIKVFGKCVGINDTGHSFPQGFFDDSTIHTIDYYVHSRDQLEILANYLSKEQAKAHGFPLRNMPSHLENHPQKDFFDKDNTIKAFVVVTDDTEKTVRKQSAGVAFLNVLKDLYTQTERSEMRFYGFVADSHDHPNKQGIPPPLGPARRRAL